jgi:MFS family permease
MIMIVAAAVVESSALYLAGAAVGGVGFGLAFLGGLRGLVSAIPVGQRGEVMSAFYVVAYLSLSVPAVLAGILVPHLGLRPTFEIFGSVVGGVALVGARQAFRTRPAGRVANVVADRSRRPDAAPVTLVRKKDRPSELVGDRANVTGNDKQLAPYPHINRRSI